MVSRASRLVSTGLEIELRIMGHRRLTGQAIGKERSERGARFQARIPFGNGQVLRPRNFPEIIQRRQVSRERKIGERNLFGGQKPAGVRELTKSAKRVAQRLTSQADRSEEHTSELQ